MPAGPADRGRRRRAAVVPKKPGGLWSRAGSLPRRRADVLTAGAQGSHKRTDERSGRLLAAYDTGENVNDGLRGAATCIAIRRSLGTAGPQRGSSLRRWPVGRRARGASGAVADPGRLLAPQQGYIYSIRLYRASTCTAVLLYIWYVYPQLM